MKLLASLLFVLTSITVTIGKEKCVIDYRNESNSLEDKLIKHVMCGYNHKIPPSDNPLHITLDMRVLHFAFNSDLQTFTLATMTSLFWSDSRLAWNSSDYGGIDDTIIQVHTVWKPYVRVINGLSDLTGLDAMTVDCRIIAYGVVMCSLKVIYRVKCGSDIRDWPYDATECALTLGLKADAGTNISIPNRLDVDFESSYNGGWNIVDCKPQKLKKLKNETLHRIQFLFHLSRRGEVTASIIVYPAIVLSALTLLSLFLDVRDHMRLGVVVFSLICHFYFLTEISQQVPLGTDSIPKILLYFRGSVVMTFLSTALTLLFNLCVKKTVPNWVVSVNQYITERLWKYFVFWKTKYVNEWTNLLNFINSIWIFVCILVYIILYFVLVPKSNGLAPVKSRNIKELMDELMN